MRLKKSNSKQNNVDKLVYLIFWRENMLDKLDRWIELLSQSGKNTKQQVLDEMKIEREKYLDYEFDKAIIQQVYIKRRTN